jgi:hypothetical protein
MKYDIKEAHRNINYHMICFIQTCDLYESDQTLWNTSTDNKMMSG